MNWVDVFVAIMVLGLILLGLVSSIEMISDYQECVETIGDMGWCFSEMFLF